MLNNKNYDEKKSQESNFSSLFLPLKKGTKLPEETTYPMEQISKFLRKKTLEINFVQIKHCLYHLKALRKKLSKSHNDFAFFIWSYEFFKVISKRWVENKISNFHYSLRQLNPFLPMRDIYLKFSLPILFYFCHNFYFIASNQKCKITSNIYVNIFENFPMVQRMFDLNKVYSYIFFLKI